MQGRAWVHELDIKIPEAGRAGYQGIELFWEDLVYAAKRFDSAATETSEKPILRAAHWVRELCDKEGLEIFVLQPFLNYDGLLDQEAHDRMIKKLHFWFKIAKVLGTEIIQVPSQVRNCCLTDSWPYLFCKSYSLDESGRNDWR
jgi:4-hydroxyphenylpyruvate dioxygenase